MSLAYRNLVRESVATARRQRALVEEIDRQDALSLLANRSEQHAAVRRGREARLALLRARVAHLGELGARRDAAVTAVTEWADETLTTDELDALLRALDAREDE